MKTNKKKTVKTVLKVETDFEKSTYNISADQGSSVNEMAFAVMAVIRVLVRDGKVKDKDTFISMVNKYYDDPQYKEV